MMLCFPSCNLISTESFGAEVLLLPFAFLKGSLKMQRQYFLKCFTFPRCNSSEPFAQTPHTQFWTEVQMHFIMSMNAIVVVELQELGFLLSVGYSRIIHYYNKCSKLQHGAHAKSSSSFPHKLKIIHTGFNKPIA